MSQAVVRRLGRIAAVAAVLALLGWWIPEYFGAYWLRTFTAVAIYALASLGVGVLYGRLGLVSLANFALLGIGAWVSLRLSLLANPLPVTVNILLAGVVAAVMGMIVGLPALRLRGLYLALVTLMFAGAFFVVINAVGFPEGGSGFDGRGGFYNIRNAPRPSFAVDDAAFFRYTLSIVALGFLLVLVLLQTRSGRAWAMVRRSEVAALSAGVNVTLYKTWAFTLAGFLAGVAGGLYSANIGRPTSGDFGAQASMLLFGLTVAAGAFHLGGAVIAGLLGRGLPALFIQQGINAEIANMIFGILLVLALTSAPTGAAGQLLGLYHGLKARLFGARTSSAPDEAAAPTEGDSVVPAAEASPAPERVQG
jgi:branched-chain amino acid transport system permease protein